MTPTINNKNAGAILAIYLLATVAAFAKVHTGPDPNIAWQNYLDNDTQVEPSYRFPHANCFRVAALTHGLPNTLLLAIARGESDFAATARSKANAHGVMQILWPTTATRKRTSKPLPTRC